MWIQLINKVKVYAMCFFSDTFAIKKAITQEAENTI